MRRALREEIAVRGRSTPKTEFALFGSGFKIFIYLHICIKYLRYFTSLATKIPPSAEQNSVGPNLKLGSSNHPYSWESDKATNSRRVVQNLQGI